MDKPVIPAELEIIREAFETEGIDLRVAGGAVRDTLLGTKPKDWDLCTPAMPELMIAIAQQAGLRTEPTGIEHGTISFILGGQAFEVTTLRRDVECDGRHALVAFTQDWAEDAMRRDLTINSLMMDFEGGIHDYTGGLADIDERRLRFVGKPEERLKEDHLRMLRLFRFANKFPDASFSIDQDSLKAVRNHSGKIADISAERIWTETKGILNGHNGVTLLPVIAETGLLSNARIPFKDSDAALRRYERGAGPIGILASQMSGPMEAAGFADDMKMSRKEREELLFYIRETDRKDAGQKRCLVLLSECVDRNWVARLAAMTGGDDEAIRSTEIPSFPVTGGDLMKAGISPGPALGKILAGMKKAWQESDFTLEKNEMLKQLERKTGSKNENAR